MAVSSISEVVKTLGLEKAEPNGLVFPKAAAASVAELSPSSEQPGLGWEHS